MNSLSFELLSHIITFLELAEPSELRHYATVSRPFQFAIERYTFSSVLLKSNELALFSSIFSHRHRRAGLRNLEYHIILPTYSVNRIAKYENTSEKEANNAAFALAVQELFEVLHSWGKPEGREMALILEAYSPMDVQYRQHLKLSLSQRQNDLGKHRYERSILQHSFSSLPSVPRICRLDMTPDLQYPRRISPATVISIAATLPALEGVSWVFSDDEKKFPGLRVQQRLDFAKALPALPMTLRSFELMFPYHEPLNHDFNHLSLESDHLTLALSLHLSKSPYLTWLYLSGPMVISEKIFDAEWPALMYFDIALSTATSNGEWYYEGNSEEWDNDGDYDLESDDENDSVHSSDSYHSEVADSYLPNREAWAEGDIPSRTYRTRLAPRFNTFLLAMGTAVNRMPKVKRLSVETNVKSQGSFEAYFYSEGEKAGAVNYERDEDVGKRRWYVTVGRKAEWVLTPEVRAVWDEVAGVGGIVHVNVENWE
ncbi:hypothetical protein K440DRAFT_658340 [Wilcoxina mikolae CBS 423.85]|nr:hypothetical protein K440DRAFT_658340 [Wilcoxina mikolae CBS 423.85]